MLVAGTAATSLTTLAVAASTGLEVGVALRAVQGFTAAIFAPAAFVYTALQVSGGASDGQLLRLRIVALPAIVAVPFVATRLSLFTAWRSGHRSRP